MPTERFRQRCRTLLPDASVLTHGTSSRRLELALASHTVRPSLTGHPLISFTTDPQVAIYFAHLATTCDREEYGDAVPILLTMRLGDLRRVGVWLTHFSDTVWGDTGNCDWENEIACWNPIDLRAVPFDVTPFVLWTEESIIALRQRLCRLGADDANE